MFLFGFILTFLSSAPEPVNIPQTQSFTPKNKEIESIITEAKDSEDKIVPKFKIYKEIDVSSGFENTKVSSLLSVPYDRFRLFVEIPEGLAKEQVKIVAQKIVFDYQENSNTDALYLFFSDFENLDGYNVASVTWDFVGTAEEKFSLLEADDHSRNTLKFNDFKVPTKINVSNQQRGLIAKEILEIEERLMKEISVENAVELEAALEKEMEKLRLKYNLSEDELNIISYGF